MGVTFGERSWSFLREGKCSAESGGIECMEKTWKVQENETQWRGIPSGLAGLARVSGERQPLSTEDFPLTRAVGFSLALWCDSSVFFLGDFKSKYRRREISSEAI